MGNTASAPSSLPPPAKPLPGAELPASPPKNESWVSPLAGTDAQVPTADPTGEGQKDVNAGTDMQHDIFHGGRYRVASKEATEMFYKQQPSRMNQDITFPEERLQDEKQLQAYLRDTEGLNIGKRRTHELSQQWRFFLASDPIQHGMDAGFLAGTCYAAISAWMKPKNRNPFRIGVMWTQGFFFGMLAFPMTLVVWEEYNMKRILRSEQDMFKRQREDFYDRVKEGRSSL